MSSKRFSWTASVARCVTGVLALLTLLATSSPARADESLLELPKLDSVTFLGGTDGRTLLMGGMGVCVLGMVFGIMIYMKLQRMPVHRAMLEISELIYATCKTYLITQIKFILGLELLIGAIMAVYFGVLRHTEPAKVVLILVCSLIGIAGSSGVAWFGMRINTFANSRTAFAALRGKPFPTYAIPLQAGMSIGTVLISIELFVMLTILLFVDPKNAGSCFIGFAIGESLGASALRIAGGIFTKIADIGSDLMKIVFNIKEDDARNPGVIADCTGDNAGDSVGPSADGFETYGVTGVALITFILLAVEPQYRVQLLVWIFAMRIMMIVASVLSYYVNETVAQGRWGNADKMNFETPLTYLVWLTSIVSVVMTFVVSKLLIPSLGGHDDLWWKLSVIISCGTLAGAIIPEVVKVFTSTESAHVREVVTSSQEGGASLNVLSGLVAGNFSGYWMGIVIVILMAAAYLVSGLGLSALMIAAPVFAFGLVAFGFLGMGPVTIAVDSYGPVTDNAQSVYELSLIENIPDIAAEVKKDFGFDLNFEKAKHFLEENDGAGNTFKATAKPVLIGTAVVGEHHHDLLDHPHHRPQVLRAPRRRGGPAQRRRGRAVAPQRALPPRPHHRRRHHLLVHRRVDAGGGHRLVPRGRVHQGQHQARRRGEGVDRGQQEGRRDLHAVRAEGDAQHLPRGLLHHAQLRLPRSAYFFIGYLISIAIFGLYQAIFMANAGGAWDNAKKLVEVEMKQKGTPLHAACVVGDTVGDPFKDTSSVAMNPIIKFSTLFGLLAVELAIELDDSVKLGLAAVFFVLSTVFVYRSFYGMRIKSGEAAAKVKAPAESAA